MLKLGSGKCRREVLRKRLRFVGKCWAAEPVPKTWEWLCDPFGGGGGTILDPFQNIVDNSGPDGQSVT